MIDLNRMFLICIFCTNRTMTIEIEVIDNDIDSNFECDSRTRCRSPDRIYVPEKRSNQEIQGSSFRIREDDLRSSQKGRADEAGHRFRRKGRDPQIKAGARQGHQGTQKRAAALREAS